MKKFPLSKTLLPGLGIAAALGFGAIGLAPAQAAPAGCQGPAGSAWMNVSVDGVRSSSGLVTITIYEDNSAKFLKKKSSVARIRVPAHAGTTSTCITLPSTGTWALAVYHDENGDRHFNRKTIGLPAEGYGFTNNPSTFAGIPAFKSVRFAVPNSGVGARIRLKYP